MSDLMDAGIINMPYDMAMMNELSRRQFYFRAQSVLQRLIVAEAELAKLMSGNSTPTHTLPPVFLMAQRVIDEGGTSWFGPGQLFDENGTRISETEENFVLAASPKAITDLLCEGSNG